LSTQRTLNGFVSDDFHPEDSLLQSAVRKVESHLPSTSVNNIPHPDNHTAIFVDNPDHFNNRTSGSDNIFADENPFARTNFKTAAELHRAVFTFGEHRPYAELATDFLAHDNPTQRGGNNDINPAVLEVAGYCAAQLGRMPGILEDLGTLKVLVAVQARGELEVPFKQGTGLLEDGENLLTIHEAKGKGNACNRIEIVAGNIEKSGKSIKE
jgi:hypothetical protein